MVVWCLFGSVIAVAQEAGDKEAEMKAYMEKIAPGPHHAHFAKAAGTWDVKSQFWMDPNLPPTETTGTSTFKVVMGGRFLEETTTAKMMGMDWEGRGVFGYDTGKKKHVGIWYDSMGTMIMNFEGDCDGTCSVITTYSEYFDPMTESTKKMKTVSTTVDDDHWKNEMFDVAADGTETKVMVVDYTRAK
jgi:hypothetical protein